MKFQNWDGGQNSLAREFTLGRRRRVCFNEIWLSNQEFWNKELFLTPLFTVFLLFTLKLNHRLASWFNFQKIIRRTHFPPSIRRKFCFSFNYSTLHSPAIQHNQWRGKIFTLRAWNLLPFIAGMRSMRLGRTGRTQYAMPYYLSVTTLCVCSGKRCATFFNREKVTLASSCKEKKAFLVAITLQRSIVSLMCFFAFLKPW